MAAWVTESDTREKSHGQKVGGNGEVYALAAVDPTASLLTLSIPRPHAKQVLNESTHDDLE